MYFYVTIRSVNFLGSFGITNRYSNNLDNEVQQSAKIQGITRDIMLLEC